jgi:hypothetical protein
MNSGKRRQQVAVQLCFPLVIVHAVNEPVAVVEWGRGDIEVDDVGRHGLDGGCHAIHEKLAVNR